MPEDLQLLTDRQLNDSILIYIYHNYNIDTKPVTQQGVIFCVETQSRGLNFTMALPEKTPFGVSAQ